MITTLASAAMHGVDAYRVDIEVDIAGGLPQYVVVGLPTAAVKEGSTRIRSALQNCGQDLPTKRVIVNLAPADRRKDGAAFDLPVAVGILLASEAPFVPGVLDNLMILGELGLDGSVRPVRGVLAAALLAREQGFRGVVVPRRCAPEAILVDGLEVYAVEHLSELLAALQGAQPLARFTAASTPVAPAPPEGDFSQVRGQPLARRAVEIAVAGGHNLLLYGTPGLGKTMLARRIPTILPELTREEALEVTRIYSAAGLVTGAGLITQRPFRAPHHTISSAALVGGGAVPRPGELSLAHRGVLFLDELPEFPRSCIEALRQPLEEKVVRINRVNSGATLPASILLVASANPCPCGWHGSSERSCVCSVFALARYRTRMSGPILDRIDLQVRVGKVTLAELRSEEDGESSATIRARVDVARDRQRRRLARHGIRLNAELGPTSARETCVLSAAAEKALAAVCGRRVAMTARGIDRMIRTARTIADLREIDVIDDEAIMEAAMFRALDVDPLVDPRLTPPPANRTAAKDSPVGTP